MVNANGINVYTAHCFRVWPQKERLGVGYVRPLWKVMRNFSVELSATGWADTRPPRKGEKHDQIILPRTPGHLGCVVILVNRGRTRS